MCLERLKLVFLAAILVCIAGCDDAKNSPDTHLKVVIIRHGEKPADKADGGDNLSCQGQNRALQLATVLFQKIGKPDYTYVPALKMDKSTAHSRMFQTVTPFAVKYDLTINSKYDATDYADTAKSVLKKSGTVLLVWSHSEMPELASALGVDNPPKWQGADFDSMWVVTYASGKAELTVDKEALNPSENCGF
jgi:phosphohistidine phosphatase SixA